MLPTPPSSVQNIDFEATKTINELRGLIVVRTFNPCAKTLIFLH